MFLRAACRGLLLCVVLIPSTESVARAQGCPRINHNGVVVEACAITPSTSDDIEEWGNTVLGIEQAPVRQVFTSSPGYEEGQRLALETDLVDVPSSIVPAVIPLPAVVVQAGVIASTNARNARVALAIDNLQNAARATGVTIAPTLSAIAPAPWFGDLQGGGERQIVQNARATDGVNSGTDPVDPSTGEFAHSSVDLELPSDGISFRHVRTYRSRNGQAGAHGFGWDHGYDRRVRSVFGGPVMDMGDGSALRFQLTEADVWSLPGLPLEIRAKYAAVGGAPLRLTSRAVMTGGGIPFYLEWTLSGDDGTTTRFDAEGRMVRLEDRHARGLDFIWSGNRLLSVRDSVGRIVDYRYSPSGFLFEIADRQSGLKASYEVDGAGDLVRATTWRAVVEQYEYAGMPSDGNFGGIQPTSVAAACADACRVQSCSASAIATECASQCSSCEASCIPQCVADCGCRETCEPACEDACEGRGPSLCNEEWDQRAGQICESCDNRCADNCDEECNVALTCAFDGDSLACQGRDDAGLLQSIGNAAATLLFGLGTIFTCPVEWLCELFGDGCGLCNFDSAEDYARRFCGKDCTVCCAEGERCAPESCNLGETCQEECERGFKGLPSSTTCVASGTVDGYSTYDACPERLERQCGERCTDRCSQSCFLGFSTQCFPTCKVECKVGCEQCQPDCVAAATASCPTECQAACVAEARTLGPRYGYRRDLAHNLLRIRNGANELLLENLYGEDVTRPSFDAVTTQQMGPWTVELDYRDLEGESAGLVSAPTSGLGAQYAVSKSSYQPVMICPFGGGYGPWFGIGTRPTRATVVVDSYGVPRTFYYDAQGRSMREVNHATLAAYSYEYDEANRLSASLGPLNRLVCREFVAWDDREQTQTRRYPGWDGNADVLAVYADELIGDKRRLNFTIDESFSRLNYATTTVGDVLTATHPSLGPVLTRTYLGHRLETEKDELTGLHRRYTYDLLGLVRTETVGTGMAAQTWTTWRHASGLVDNRVDPRGNQTFYLWNGGVLDRVTEFSAGRFLVTDLEYDAAQRPFRVTEGQKQTEIGYDALGRAQTVTVRALDGSAPDQVTCVRQGPDGRLIESVSAEGERVRITYDGEGRPTRVEAGALPPSDATWDDACGAPEGTEAGVVAEAHYDAAGRVDLTWSARTGGWTSYAYDGLDRLVKVREPNGLERRFGYDARGLVVWEMAHREGGSPTWPPSETDPRLLSASEHQYDAVGRRTRTDEWHLLNGQRVGDGRETTTWVYEPAKVTITSDSEGQTIVTNDDAGREISRKLATGDVVTTSYGSGDRVTTRGPAPTPTGVLEETILLTPFGAPSERWVGGERVAEWAYDDRLRPFQHTEEWLGRREFAYDGLDRLTGVTHSGVGVANGYESYEWDRSNRLVEHTTPLDATTWIRDALGRVVEETNLHASRTFLYTGTSPNPFQRQEGVLFALDHAHGELKTERGPREARHYERDALGRVTRVWRGAAGSTTPTSDVRMTYDTLSNLASESTNGMTTTHGYNGRRRIRTNTIERTLDPLGRLKSLTLYGTTLGTWTYFGVGGPTTRSGPSGVTTYGYDERGRRVSVQRVAGEQTQTWTKSYDRIARRITTERNGEAPWVATLDGRGRVQSETSNGSERSYDVDEGHNIFRWGGSQAQLLAGDMYASRDGLPVTYDAAGQLTSERGRAYAWTDFGELESVSGLGTSVTYRYDALGRLVTRMPVGAPTETIVWDGWRRVGRSTVDESATLVYGDGLDELLFEYGSWGSGGASAMMQNVGEPCDSVGPGGCDDPPPPPSGGSYEAVIEQDDQGTPVLAENARWTSAEQLTAHGEETVGTPFGTPLGTLSTIGFQGQMRDPLNDLVHMRARWYDPAWGRFLSSDPVGLAGGSNRYAFANGAHALFTDPFGLSPVSPVGHYAGIDPHPAAFADAWQPTRYRFDLVGYHPGVDTGSGPLNFAANGGLGIANLLAGLVNVVSNGTGELEELAVNALADAGFGGDATDVRRQLMIPGAVTQFSRLGSVDDAVIGVRQLVSPGRKSVQRHAFVALGDNSLVFVRGGGPDLAPTNVPGLIPIPRGVRNTTPSPALKGSPYHPKSVAARIRPEYRANPAHNPSSPHFDPRKTPEPSDAASVYQDAKPADIGTWYGRGIGGWYRYFSDNAGGVHFSGIVPESRVPAAILRGH